MDSRATGRLRTATPSAALFLGLALTACETLGTRNLLSNEMIGAVTGGVGCAAVSKLTGGDDRQIAVAAVVCGVVGYGVTRELESRREAFATDEQFYAAESERLRAYERELATDIDVARRELSADAMRIESLVAAAERFDAERDELGRLNADLERRRVALEAQLATAEENRTYHKGLVVRMRETQGSVAASESEQLAKLEASVAELAALVGEHETQTASLGAYL